MNIPQNLINLIEKGQAVYQVAALGGSGAYTIPCPENKYIVIFGFRWNHFVQVNPADTLEVEKLNYILNHVQFQSKVQRFVYNFRCIIQFINIAQISGAFKRIIPNSPAELVPTYQYHQSDINISVWNSFPTDQMGLTTFAPVPQQVGTMENPPSGYGMSNSGGLSVQQDILTNAGETDWVVNPQSDRNNKDGGSRFQFITQLESDVALQPIRSNHNDDGLYTFPLFDVYYIVANKATRSNQRE